jgi:hypothetical protein
MLGKYKTGFLQKKPPKGHVSLKISCGGGIYTIFLLKNFPTCKYRILIVLF